MKFLPIRLETSVGANMKTTVINLLQAIVRLLARATIRRFHPQVIAITGSVGKTSSKEAIAAVVSAVRRVRKSSANFNNELGVPLTILGSWSRIGRPVLLFWLRVIGWGMLQLIVGSKRWYPQVLVLEYGADRTGDITALCGIAKPSIAIISGIGKIPVHVENYTGGIDAVIREKGKLIAGLLASDTAVLNHDDTAVVSLESKTRARVMRYGFREECDVRILDFHHSTEGLSIRGISFKLARGGTVVPVVIRNVFSLSHAYAAACAAAVASLFDLNIVDAAQALMRDYVPLQGRSLVRPGIKHTQIIDESYNSSPPALEKALATMALVSSRRRVAVLGDMLELGDFTLRAHETAGRQIFRSVEILVTVGSRAKFIAQAALKNGMRKDAVYICGTVEEGIEVLKRVLEQNDLVFIKGSRAVGLEKMVEAVAEM